eukprot:2905768-Pleurochrysis_carterae.AAC.1
MRVLKRDMSLSGYVISKYHTDVPRARGNNQHYQDVGDLHRLFYMCRTPDSTAPTTIVKWSS